jgi:CheY-like chemotaxis protein
MAGVLVVDDDAGIRQLVVLILQQDGHDVLWAANGLEGLMVYFSYRTRIDLVLTDIDMPQMNGVDLAFRIRAQDPSRKIMLMSGRAPEGAKLPEDCRFLPKPFLPDQLLACVKEALKT